MSSRNIFPEHLPSEDVWPLAIRRTGDSDTVIGAACGVSADAVRKWRTRVSTPGWPAIVGFCQAYPWLRDFVIPAPEHKADVVKLEVGKKRRAG